MRPDCGESSQSMKKRGECIKAEFVDEKNFRLTIGEQELCFPANIVSSVVIEMERAIYYRKKKMMEKAVQKRMEMLASPVDIEMNHPDIINLR